MAEQIIRFLLETEDESEGEVPKEPGWALKPFKYASPAWAMDIGGKIYSGETDYDMIEDALLSGAFLPEYPPDSLEFWRYYSEILRQHGAKIVWRPPMGKFDMRDDFSQDYIGLEPPAAKRRLGDES